MEERHLDRIISVNPEGLLCIDNQVVDSDMILFEEEAKSLLEQELMEGPLLSYSEEEEDYSLFEEDSDDYLEDDYISDEDISFFDGSSDISNDDFDINF
jgi:hypothetical protein